MCFTFYINFSKMCLKKPFVLIIYMTHLFLGLNCNKYCGDVCNNTKQHTLCKFQSEDPARHCVDFEITIKTEKDKQAIVDKLNSRRNKVASGEIRSLPPAANMMKLEWNRELEMTAQRWANQCVKHSVPDIKDNCRDLGNIYVGQNIATICGEAPGLTPLALVDVWYMELLNMNASVLARYRPSSETGYSHYDYFTQLLWGESQLVGCGGVKFKERLQGLSSHRNRTVYRLVCNFAPGGNRLNESVYLAGIPCSGCSNVGYCDSIHKSLCETNTTESRKSITENISEVESTVAPTLYTTANDGPEIGSITEDTTTPFKGRNIPTVPPSAEMSTLDTDYTPFDYFSHLHKFTREMLSTPPPSASPCKDVLVVDDFVDLLKKKLSTDPMFREILLTTKIPLQVEKITDATIAALLSRVYSKKGRTTTLKTFVNEFVNSTLLVDLVEAVIFRNSDKIRSTLATDLRTELYDVSPVRVQAELAEVKPNAEFAGHYFFPEDIESVDENSSGGSTDLYYDMSNIPHISDVVLEIEDLRRNTETKDFLDEILESESSTESIVCNTINNKREIKALNESRSNKDLTQRMPREGNYKRYDEGQQTNECVDTEDKNEDKLVSRYRKYRVFKYRCLLKKLASDLNHLKLNERFHCLQNYSVQRAMTLLVAAVYLLVFFILFHTSVHISVSCV